MNNNLTTQDILGELFGSKVKARLLKFLFRHQEEAFRIGEIARRIQSNYNTTHSYIKDLYKIGLIKVQDEPQKSLKELMTIENAQSQAQIFNNSSQKIDGAPKSQSAPTADAKNEEEPEGRLFMINPHFPLFKELSALVLKTNPIAESDVAAELKSLGRVRLAVVCGSFLNETNSPVDFFLVADDLNKEKFEEFINRLEAEVGKPLNYTFMDTSEFTYRYNIYDRFIRNVFKNNHRKLINELNFEL